MSVFVQGLLISGITLLDRLAIALNHAIQISNEVSEYVSGLIRNILKALGILTVDVSNITADLINWVLRKFSAAVYRLSVEAIRIVHLR